MPATEPGIPSVELQQLAQTFGVQLEYRDMSGQMKAASTETLLAILKVLGADLQSEADAPRALRESWLASWRRGLRPVVVLWEEDGDGEIRVDIPEALASKKFHCWLELESKATNEWPLPLESATLLEVEGERFLTLSVALPPVLPTGYHRFGVKSSDLSYSATSFLIRAPRKAYEPPEASSRKPWGVFCPLYALHSTKSMGAGDFSDLERLINWTAAQGGGLVATLPMLASTFDGPDPVVSPYSPTSRLFWNEFYLDLNRIPELANCPAALALIEAEETSREVEALRESGLVDYGRQMRLKRAVLERLAVNYFEDPSIANDGLNQFRMEHQGVEDYAAFQASGEEEGRNWRVWPTTEHESNNPHLLSAAYRYHMYVQWKCDEQLQALSAKAKAHGLVWYLDFPVGVDHNSFDVWKHQEIFATGASVGCPPDPVFTKGQNWGFPPAHPDRQRESGYAYLIESIRNHLRYANALRIDHVMGLHRLFWIPKGAEAKDGAFVSTPAEEIYAILSVESHRHKAWLVGEDLGTVPPEVDQAMKAHNVRGMYVIQYEIRADEKQPLRDVPTSTVASVNTHDMPPFASFWTGLDLEDRKDLGLLDQTRLESEKKLRDDQRKALIRFLSEAGHLASDTPA